MLSPPLLPLYVLKVCASIFFTFEFKDKIESAGFILSILNPSKRASKNLSASFGSYFAPATKNKKNLSDEPG